MAYKTLRSGIPLDHRAPAYKSMGGVIQHDIPRQAEDASDLSSTQRSRDERRMRPNLVFERQEAKNRSINSVDLAEVI